MKKEYPTPSGKCPICTINYYPPDDKPAIWPCNIGLFREENRKKEDQGKCPWETKEVQKQSMLVATWEKIAGLLGSMHGNG